MKKPKKDPRPHFATYKLYENDMKAALKIHARDLKRWEKKREGAKPWIADAFRKYVQSLSSAGVLCLFLTGCTQTEPHPIPQCTTHEWSDSVVTRPCKDLKGGIGE